MPTLMKDVVGKVLEDSGISKARMGKLLGFKNRETFYKHFKKYDIDLELYNRIMTKLAEMGARIDKTITFSFISGGSSKPWENKSGDNGINISDAITQKYKGNNSSQQESDMHGNFVGNTKEVNHNYNSPITTELIKELAESYKITINVLQKTIEEKDKHIKELTELMQKRSI